MVAGGGGRSEWGAWIALKLVPGIGNTLGLGLVRAFGSPRAVFAAGEGALQVAGVRREVRAALCRFDRWREVDAQLLRLERSGGRLVTWDDESYPELLRQIQDPPLYLHMLGEILPADGAAVAVVGSRDASAYARHMAAVIAEGVAGRGFTVVSGLARGVDGVAHDAALRAGGRTIAVLGSGIDVVYPSEHHRLLMRIAKTGAVLSEYPMGTPPDADNFPARNRIISGLSLATVVVEAGERSGSLITARLAADQGREVFAVPGPVGLRTRGTHQLLRQGAGLAEGAEDVVREIAPQMRPAPPPEAVVLSDLEVAVVAQLDALPRSVDEIIARTGLGAAAVLEALLVLELRGVVRQVIGQGFARSSA